MLFESALFDGLLLEAGQASQNVPGIFQEKRNGRCQQKAEETCFATDQTFHGELKLIIYKIIRGSPFDSRPFPMQLDHYAKYTVFDHTLFIAITFERIMQFLNPY